MSMFTPRVIVTGENKKVYNLVYNIYRKQPNHYKLKNILIRLCQLFNYKKIIILVDIYFENTRNQGCHIPSEVFFYACVDSYSEVSIHSRTPKKKGSVLFD